MRVIVIALAVALPLVFAGSAAQALTCAQQAKICARQAKHVFGKPQNVPKCLSAARLAACRKTCIFTGTDGRQWPASGDCKRRSHSGWADTA